MTADVRAPSAAAPKADARSGLLASRPWAAVGLLMLLCALNTLDRILPSILAEPMKRELGLSDTFLGVLNGVGFLSVYALAGIPIARVADRGRYGAVISAALAVWSLLTAISGLVGAGWQLALTRMGVALGEAGSTPAAHAHISRNFKPEQRGAALGLFTLGLPLGQMAGLVGGGVIGDLLGWRGTFLLMGLAGLLFAPFVLLALGPGQPLPRYAAAEPGGLIRLLRKRTVLLILLSTSFMSMAGYSNAFAPAFLIRAHGMSVGSVGLQLGLLSGGFGAVGLLTMGWIASQLSKRDPRWMLAVLAAVSLACAPFAVAAYRVADQATAVACIALSQVIPTAYMALTVACIHSLVPPAVRARASAALLFCSATFGGLGPLITGIISDALGPGGLERAMLIVPIGYALAGLGYILAMGSISRDTIEE